MAYSINSTNDGCYPGTSVLINKQGIKNQEALDKIESVNVTVRSTEIEIDPPNTPFTFSFYCGLHKRLFGDIYEWAGELRTVNISKKGTTFYPAEKLLELGEAKFDRLIGMKEFRGLKHQQLVDEITDFYHELNMLHPFREGNGRTQRLFFTLLLRRLNYSVNFAECDTDELMMATIYAAQGVMTYLHDFFEKLLK